MKAAATLEDCISSTVHRPLIIKPRTHRTHADGGAASHSAGRQREIKLGLLFLFLPSSRWQHPCTCVCASSSQRLWSAMMFCLYYETHKCCRVASSLQQVLPNVDYKCCCSIKLTLKSLLKILIDFKVVKKSLTRSPLTENDYLFRLETTEISWLSCHQLLLPKAPSPNAVAIHLRDDTPHWAPPGTTIVREQNATQHLNQYCKDQRVQRSFQWPG